ncbi:MAG: glycerol kinase GlpK [Chloroflexota bacterium]|nr:MAG: glycerol kinase GlpK [Chloroflexota bacterium]
MPQIIASIDQGTTSTRCMLFDYEGKVLSAAQKEHAQIYPKPGWVEHDPMEIWQSTQEVVDRCLATASVNPKDILALGITNQRETTLVWDKKTGEPFGNAVVWQDTRTKEMCDALAQVGGIDCFRDQTGLPLATYFSGPKINWILDNSRDARVAAQRGEALFGNIDTWLIWWLTGGPNGGSHVTDVTNASRTLLMNLETLDWDANLLDVFGIPHQILPRIVPSSDPQTWGSTKMTGPFRAEVPVCGDLGDQQAALVGQACFSPGEAKNTYGTGCFMLLNTGKEIVHSKSGLLTTVAYQLGDTEAIFALEGSVAITGALIQWLRDNLGLIENSPDVETLAREVPDNGGVYFVPAFSGLFAPYWRSDARGVIAGLTRFTNKNHIARAALEATAFQTREVLEAMQEDSKVELSQLKVDGGMVANELLMQFQADILNVPVVRPKLSETTALGAAYAAGLAVGFWNNVNELRANWNQDKFWQPQMDSETRQALFNNWKKAVTRTFNWIE